MAMQEGRRSRGEEEEEDAVTTFVWSELPKEVQHKVLSCLPIQELCQARCVCKDWRDAIHRREFRAMYDAVNSQSPSPVICYMESSYPVRLEWSAYDYAARTWKRMTSSTFAVTAACPRSEAFSASTSGSNRERLAATSTSHRQA
jgi:hypothetical protein